MSYDVLYQPASLLVLAAARMDQLVEAWAPVSWDWDEANVGAWIQKVLNLPYRACFERNFITGKKLINLEARHLSMMNISNWEHIQYITRNLRSLFHQQLDHHQRPLASAWPGLLEQYWRTRARNNLTFDRFSFSDFLESKKLLPPRSERCGVESRQAGRRDKIKVGRSTC